MLHLQGEVYLGPLLKRQTCADLCHRFSVKKM